MLGVLCAHHADRLRHKRIATGLEHGKQDVFFLHHVGKQILFSFLQQIGQPRRHVWMFAMHRLDSPRHTDQFRKLFTMHCVVALQNMVDQADRIVNRSIHGMTPYKHSFDLHVLYTI